jgi:hypothetical protein
LGRGFEEGNSSRTISSPPEETPAKLLSKMEDRCGVSENNRNCHPTSCMSLSSPHVLVPFLTRPASPPQPQCCNNQSHGKHDHPFSLASQSDQKPEQQRPKVSNPSGYRFRTTNEQTTPVSGSRWRMEESVTAYPESRIATPHIVASGPRRCNNAAWEGTHLWTEGRQSDRKARNSHRNASSDGLNHCSGVDRLLHCQFQHAQIAIFQSPMTTSEACAPEAFRSPRGTSCDPRR